MRIAVAVLLMFARSVFPVANAADPDFAAAVQAQREFADAYAVVANLKRSVAQAWAASGRFPPTYAEASLDGPMNGGYFTVELGSDGLLKITFNDGADSALAGAVVTTVPTINQMGDIVWYCFAPKIPKYIRPACG